jgi:endonuclease YncB( thermonuclease family)
MLLGCVSPSSPDLAEASRASLEALAGGSVRVQHHGILGTNPTQQEAPEARGPIVAEVFAVASGANLAESQLSAGWVRATEGASKEYRALEAKAHKAQIGQWKEIE